ncbi:MAG TPA: hypothetical protein DCX78_06575 [Nitrospina sp.]|nr:hypothetical protein [Nitrospina sp.]
MIITSLLGTPVSGDDTNPKGNSQIWGNANLSIYLTPLLAGFNSNFFTGMQRQSTSCVNFQFFNGFKLKCKKEEKSLSRVRRGGW